MPYGLRIGRIFGIDIHVDWSLIIIFWLITLSLATAAFPLWHPAWSPAVVWTVAVIAALLFLVSILLHELSHALVARQKGIPISRITLFVFGGMAHMEGEPRDWRAELWVALAGPLTSLVIGIGCSFAAATLWRGAISADGVALGALGPAATALAWLGSVNIMIALFNLVPGFPLDGGRVLRASLWGATGDLRRATWWATNAGRVVAWLLMISGVAMMLGVRVPVLGTGFIGGLWMTLIGWFLHSAAVAAWVQMVARQSLQDVPVARLMRAVESVRADMTLDELVDRHLLTSDQRAYPVVDSEGGLMGLICFQDVRRVPRERWATTRVAEAMTPQDRLAIVDARADAADVLMKLGERDVAQVPVVDKGRLRGLIRREDVLRWLALHEPLPH